MNDHLGSSDLTPENRSISRYQALRRIGCGPFAAAFIAALNWLRGYPPNRIVFLTVDITIAQGISE